MQYRESKKQVQQKPLTDINKIKKADGLATAKDKTLLTGKDDFWTMTRMNE